MDSALIIHFGGKARKSSFLPLSTLCEMSCRVPLEAYAAGDGVNIWEHGFVCSDTNPNDRPAMYTWWLRLHRWEIVALPKQPKKHQLETNGDEKRPTAGRDALNPNSYARADFGRVHGSAQPGRF